jgi:hypothetical protein
MPFMVDDIALCEKVLALAVENAGKPCPPELALDIAEEIFGMEDRFVTELEASPVPFVIERRQKRARNYIVKRGLIYIHVRSRPNVAIVVPPHFVTDFASSPAVFRWLVPQDGPYSAAAVIHDWLYSIAEPPPKPPQFRKERFRADRIFLEAMRTSGVNAFKKSVLYRSARLFGAGGFGAIDELRFIDPRAPERLIDPKFFDKNALRTFTIIPRPEKPKTRARLFF